MSGANVHRALRVTGLIFDVDTFAVHDGPGIRMAVYLKGCPLHCDWCHSPESQHPGPELVYMQDRCETCGVCVEVCNGHLHHANDGGHWVDRSACLVCGTCARECPTGALEVKGRRVTAESIIRRAARLEPFFRHSGGGITLTGGEVTQQPEFAAAVLEGCRDQGIHTAIETCGLCRAETISRLADLSDLVLYDMKLYDDELHRRHTGSGNKRIMENLRLVDPAKVIVRVPIIPGITDSPINVGAIGEYASDLGISRLQLLPYNQAAGAKYEWLGRRYEIAGETTKGPIP